MSKALPLLVSFVPMLNKGCEPQTCWAMWNAAHIAETVSLLGILEIK